MVSKEEIERMVEETPAGDLSVRNINYDVHSGNAPQRPHARIEDLMGNTTGWSSYEEMARAGADIKSDGRGGWYREVIKHTGGEPQKDANGNVTAYPRTLEKRPVALSVASAKATGADYWAGGTWVRRGLKPESESVENLGTEGTAVVFYEPVEQAQDAPQTVSKSSEGSFHLGDSHARTDAPAPRAGGDKGGK